ncbi:MAG: hypothetical protein ACOY9B_03735 [Pseudomonadota bacterium]
MKAVLIPCVLVLCALAAAGCRRPEPDKPDKPVEPQSGARHGELHDAVQRPIDRARRAEAAAEDAAARRRAAIEEAEGG